MRVQIRFHDVEVMSMSLAHTSWSPLDTVGDDPGMAIVNWLEELAPTVFVSVVSRVLFEPLGSSTVEILNAILALLLFVTVTVCCVVVPSCWLLWSGMPDTSIFDLSIETGAGFTVIDCRSRTWMALVESMYVS